MFYLTVYVNEYANKNPLAYWCGTIIVDQYTRESQCTHYPYQTWGEIVKR